MDIDDQELTRILRAAVEESTASLHYARPLPRVATRGRRPLVPVLAVAAASAALALASIPIVADTLGPHQELSTESEISAGRIIANDQQALDGALSDPARLQGQPQSSTPATLGTPGATPEAPFPVEVTVVTSVPSQAVRYEALDGYDGTHVRGWVSTDPAAGGVVWLQDDGGLVTEITARHVGSGEVLASLLLDSVSTP
ncbi:hypothetical protein [Nocardioides sp.]|uniref:hypothetical protein n=1 Tax=Nocardioides sp. TaxID=35761 RepID=UPI0037834DC0